MARVEVHKEVPKQLNAGVWNLCFQKVTYYYNNGDKQDGYRFIWRRPDGKLQAARGQARIESYEQMHELIDLAKKEGFFEEKPRVIIDNELLDNLTAQAKENPRLRQAYDLRTSPEDSSQRLLNACEPGTVLPIHRHRNTTETITCLRGKCVQYLYDSEGNQTNAIYMAPCSDVMGMSVEAGQWHRLESLESGTVILECKDGTYEPLSEEDIMSK